MRAEANTTANNTTTTVCVDRGISINIENFGKIKPLYLSPYNVSPIDGK